jgi:S-formylglutathione hydrolase FrmB
MGLIVREIESAALKGNLLGDPHRRKVVVYLPPGYAASDTRYPSTYFLHGFGVDALAYLAEFTIAAGPEWRSMGHMLDDLIERGRLPPTIVVFPDGSNRWGCSQWVGNPVQGDYDAYVAEEIVGYVDRTFRTIPDRASRGLTGSSSGGIGAYHLAVRHPDVFGAVAIRSADSYMQVTHMEYLFGLLNDCPPGGPEGPMRHSRPSWITYGLAVAYSPNVDRPPFYCDLPVRYPTGELIGEVWQRWLAYDPVVACRYHLDALRRLAIYLDVGSRDEHNFHFGHRILSERLRAAGVAHTALEHDGTHSSRWYERAALALEWLSTAAPPAVP